MRRLLPAAVLAAAVLLGASGCPSNEGPTVTTTKTPDRDRPIVENRTELKNMPGGEGKDHIRIRICTSGAHSGCDTYPPSKVKYCHPGDYWPECKND